mmetsp:Transcript_15814/g.26989  ORF Transcript_15814/g.26989 Transcript_15814/m.26989 type:complete len:224 (+) Transcript_15814:39-710(+)|eukprot:CAMPEP_0183722438 /NCGR_PEP_ID=MMETSP0737-20130205/14393_1 /TAXON_ID=385413 /ORGANISM="Thalassiosira miniscula, Strain CCMP1093" /LENGTH=223 /DNA_ID=CAMNT_0025952597 /DNA_START=161 /DNA_END=832 /DNA_ORIENTATION=+
MATPSSICYSIITSIFAATAFLLAWAAEFNCAFLSFTSDTSTFSQPITVHFGIWSYQFWTVATSTGGSVIFETCHRYPGDVEVDGSWKAARAFSTLTLIFGGVFLLINLIASCIHPTRNTSPLESTAFLLASIFQGLSLLLLNSSLCKNNAILYTLQSDMSKLGNPAIEFPETCSLSMGANCAIAAIVFWALAACMSGMSRVAERREKEESEITEPFIPGENL